jgi:hypothetical protein
VAGSSGNSNYVYYAPVTSTGVGLYPASFNGVTSYIDAGNAVSLNIVNAITLVAWINPYSYTSYGGIVQKYSSVVGDGYALRELSGGNLVVDFFNSAGTDTEAVSSAIPLDQWSMVVGVFVPGNSVSAYLNTVQTSAATASVNIYSNTYNVIIGSGYPYTGYNFNGLIADVQIYNSVLSSSQITQLYQEGIQGAPISGQGLAGWWPLNGNANDYSGYGNTGTTTNVVYSPTWLSGPNYPISDDQLSCVSFSP